ncbi:hypothetical protein EO267_17190 [Salmonella enterica subsp. enterica serovar Saintpaul]|nr:hypothetical protein [Salmonella enterica subsp. enterica serovar Saintpaul]ECA7243497.1 hypothetical protein [Salmonella enterica subsp. enterica serovar Saintpaul]
MKLTIEDVQVAIKGVTKYSNTFIYEKLLAVVAGNYAKGNNIITVHLQSLYEDENFDSVVGEIKNLYYTEDDGRAQLRGDITFDTELLDLQSLLHSLANGCVYLSPYFMNIASQNHCFACLSSVTISKAEDATFLGIEPLDISALDKLINALYKEPATEAPESDIRFNKKYDNVNGGFAGRLEIKTEKPVKKHGDSIFVISSFIPALNRYCDDKRILGLIGLIIAVAGASPNCRQDEIEAVYRKPLDEIIDIFVREWSGVPQQGH